MVKFRTDPPDPKEFPRLALIWPAASAAILLAFVALAENAGHVWNIHGDAVLLIVVFAALLIFGGIALMVALSSLLPALKRHPTLRTRTNIACTVVGAVSLLAAGGLLMWVVVKLASS